MTDDLRELDVDTCLRLLSEHHFGRLGVVDDDGPLVVPVNYLWHGGTVLFRSDLGTKLAAAEERSRAAFEIDHVDEINRVGWSVVVRGRLREVVDPLELDELEQVGVTPFVVGAGKHHHVRLQPTSITGRVTSVPADLPEGWYRSALLGTTAIRPDADQPTA